MHENISVCPCVAKIYVSEKCRKTIQTTYERQGLSPGKMQAPKTGVVSQSTDLVAPSLKVALFLFFELSVAV